MRYLLIAVILFLVGMLLTALPSGRQIRAARLRQQALKLGIQIRVQSDKQLELLRGQIAYLRPLQQDAPHWRLVRVASLVSRQDEEYRELVYIGSERLKIDGWLAEGIVPAISEAMRDKLQLLLSDLPEGVHCIGVGAVGVFVIWDEAAGMEALEPIADVLAWLEQQS